MMTKFANGIYEVLNPEKYSGNKKPHYRSSWEHVFCKFCDNHPNIINWASESIKIPYKNPFTNRQSVYVPDFLIVYIDKHGKKHAELIEVKPSTQAILNEKTSKRDRLTIAINHAKWEAAAKWCRLKGLKFRIVTEQELFNYTKQ